MKYAKVREGLNVSRLALGCWRMDALADADADRVVGTALENGINFFDNADIYGGGVCEEKFGVQIDDDEIHRFVTVGDIVNYLNEEIGDK